MTLVIRTRVSDLNRLFYTAYHPSTKRMMMAQQLIHFTLIWPKAKMIPTYPSSWDSVRPKCNS